MAKNPWDVVSVEPDDGRPFNPWAVVGVEDDVDTSRDDAESRRLSTQSEMRKDQAELDAASQPAIRYPSMGRREVREEKPADAGVMWEMRETPQQRLDRVYETDKAGGFGGKSGFAEVSGRQRALEEEIRQDAIGQPTGVAEPIPGQEATVGRVAKDLLWDAPLEGLRQARGALRYGAGAAADSDILREKGLGELRDTALASETEKPRFEQEWVNDIYQGTRSFIQQAPAIAAAAVTGVPLALAYLAMPTAGQAFEKYNRRGATDKESILGGLSEAAIEVATEALPMSYMVKTLGKAGLGRFLAGFFGREMTGEQAATAFQDAVDTAIANPNKSWSEYWAERAPAAMSTALGVVGAAGAAGALQTGANLVAGRREQPLPTAGQMVDRVFRTPVPDIAGKSAVEQQLRVVEDASIMGAKTADEAIAAATQAVSRPSVVAPEVDKVQPIVPMRPAAPVVPPVDESVFNTEVPGAAQGQGLGQEIPAAFPASQPEAAGQVAPVQQAAEFAAQPQAEQAAAEPATPRNWRWIRIADRTDAELAQGLQEARTENSRRGIQAEIDRRSVGFSERREGLAQPSPEPVVQAVQPFTGLEQAAPTEQAPQAETFRAATLGGETKAPPAAPQQRQTKTQAELAESLAQRLERRAELAEKSEEFERAAELRAEAESVRFRSRPGMRRAAPVEDFTGAEEEVAKDLSLPKEKFVVASDNELDSDTLSWSKKYGVEAYYDEDTDKFVVFTGNIYPTSYKDRNGKEHRVLTKRERMKWVLTHEAFHRGFRIYEEGKYKGPISKLRDARGFTETLSKVASNKNVSTIAQRLVEERAKRGNTLQKGMSIEEAMVEIGTAMTSGRWDELKGRYGVDISPPAQYGMRKAWNAFADFWRKVLRRVTNRDVPFSDSEVLAILKQVKKAAGKPLPAQGKTKVGPMGRGAQSTRQDRLDQDRSTAETDDMKAEADRLQELVDAARDDGRAIDRRAWRNTWVEDLPDWTDYDDAQASVDELRSMIDLRQSLRDMEVDDVGYTEAPKPQVQDLMEAGQRPFDDEDLPPKIPERAFTDRATQAQREKVPPAQSVEDYNVGDDRAESIHAREMNESLARAATSRVEAQPQEEQLQEKRGRRATPKNFRDTAFNDHTGDLFTAIPRTARKRLMAAWKELRGKGGFFELEQNPWQRTQAVSVDDAVSEETVKKAISVLGLDKKYDIRVTPRVENRSWGEVGSIEVVFYKKGELGRSSGYLGVGRISYHDPEGGRRYYTGPAGYPDAKAWFYVLHTTGFSSDGTGKKFYILANQVASMNGILISPDGVLTTVNNFRRTENMIAAAMRLGDKMTIIPHVTQNIYGWNHRPANAEQYERNLVRMLVASARNIQRLANKFPRELENIDKLRYLPDEDRFVMADGSSGEELADLIWEKSAINPWGETSESKQRWAGRTSIARMALTQAILAKESPEKKITTVKKPLVQSTAPVRLWAEEVQRGGRRADTQVPLVRSTSETLRVGGIYRPIHIDVVHGRHIFNKHPEITPNDIAALPQLLQKPRAILKNREGEQRGKPGSGKIVPGWFLILDGRAPQRPDGLPGDPLVVAIANNNAFGPSSKPLQVTEVLTEFGWHDSGESVAQSLLNGDVIWMAGKEIARLADLLPKDAHQLPEEGSPELRPAHPQRTRGQAPPANRSTGQIKTVRVLSDEAVVKFRDNPQGNEWKNATVEVSLPSNAAELMRGKVFSTSPIWYSELQRQVEGINAKEMAPQYWIERINTLKGVKPDEIEWSGIKEWLSLQEGKVSKAQILEYLGENGLRIEETVVNEDDTMFEEYQIGGERKDYTEVSLTLPLKTTSVKLFVRKLEPETVEKKVVDNMQERLKEINDSLAELRDDYRNKRPIDEVDPDNDIYEEVYEDLRDELLEEREEITDELDKISGKKVQWGVYFSKKNADGVTRDELINILPSKAQATAFAKKGYAEPEEGAWEVPMGHEIGDGLIGNFNRVAHFRYNERQGPNGERILFIEEVQSDWAQYGRKYGFLGGESRIDYGAWAVKKKTSTDPHTKEKFRRTYVYDERGRIVIDLDPSVSKDEAMRLAKERYEKEHRPPAGPFVNKTEAWVSLTMKRIIALAAEKGFDKVAWTRGVQQAERYKYEDETQEDYETRLNGMRSFYDVMLPGITNKVLQKLGGGKVGEVKISFTPSDRKHHVKRTTSAKNSLWDVYYFSRGASQIVLGRYPTKEAAQEAARQLDERESATNNSGQIDQPGFEVTPNLREKALAGMPIMSTAPINTPEFRDWFGDSKVVDEDGKPMVMYHSTNAGHKEWGGVPTEAYDFESFDTARSEMGSHFGTKEQANAFGGGHLRRVVPAYLSIKNPLRLKDYGGFSPSGVSSQLVDLGIITETEAERIYDDFGFQYLNDQKFLQDKIKEAGYDGIVYLNRRESVEANDETDVLSDEDFKLQFPEAQDSWIAFDRGQIKSPFNRGTFDATKDDFLQSTAPGNPLNSWNIPDETKWQAIRRYAQDYMLRVKVLQNALKAQGGTVDESRDVAAAAERMHGRIQVSVERLKEQFMKPLMKKLADSGLTPDDLAIYSYAKHAKERNDHIARIRPSMPDGGSGMTNDDAQAIFDTADQAGLKTALESAHKDLMALGAATRRILLEEGLISQQTYDNWENLYENYIPLRGFEHVDEEGSVIRTGRGVDVRGKESIRALGRRTRAANLIENMILDYERAIVRAEKNLVGRTFFSLVQANPDPTLWEIDPNRVSTTFDKQRDLVIQRRVPDKGEDTIAFKEGGDIVYIKVKDPLLLRAMKRTYMDESGEFQHILSENIGWYNTWLRNTLTAYNPAFLVVNGIRDAQTGAFSALDKLGPQAIPKYTKHYFGAMKAAWNMATLKNQNTDWGQWVTEFENAGAITGGFYMRDAKRVSEELKGMLVDAGGTLEESKPGIRGAVENAYLKARGSLAGKLAAKTVQYVEHMGQASENMSRLALYRTARELGKTPSEAASIAKNGTVNFNTKGELGTGINALYLFYNASVQGATRTLEAMKSPHVRVALAGQTAIAAALAALAPMIGGDDDDEVSFWDKIPDYEKERNLIIMLPPKEGRANYIKVPAPYGFSVFNVLGYAMADTARWMQDPRRGKSPMKGAINMASAILGSYNPFGGNLDPTDEKSLLLLASPTITDLPIMFLGEVNSFGDRTAPPPSIFYQRPDSERFFLSDAGTVQQRLSRWLNQQTRGSQAKSGWIDVTPATFETAVRAGTGGAGMFVMDVVNTLSQMIDPVEDVQTKNVPWLKSVYGKSDEKTTSRQFYENRDEIEKDYRQLLGSMKLGIKVEMDGENKALIRIGKHMDAVNEHMSKLRKAEVAVIENTKLSETEKKARRKELAVQREKLMKGFNKAFNEVWAPAR